MPDLPTLCVCFTTHEHGGDLSRPSPGYSEDAESIREASGDVIELRYPSCPEAGDLRA